MNSSGSTECECENEWHVLDDAMRAGNVALRSAEILKALRADWRIDLRIRISLILRPK